MKRLLAQALILAHALSASLLAGNSVVNMSHYDAMRPDFVTMRKSGIKAAIHEATYPVGAIDDKYTQRQNAALRAGLLWGAYHFADATDPIRQADRFVNFVGAQWKSAPHAAGSPGVVLVLDFEKNHYRGGTMRIDQAIAFIKRVRERTGTTPGVYSGEYRIRDVINQPSVSHSAKHALSNSWLWIANYHHRPHSTKPWSHWTMWQYTGDGVCDLPRSSYPTGIANVRPSERSFFAGGDAAIESFWARHAWNPSGKSR